MDQIGADFTKVAAAYSTFAGVLAGFVFAVMVFLLGSRRRLSRRDRDKALDSTLSWSVLAFVCLSLSSFLYAILSGEDRFNLSATGDPGSTRIRPLVLLIIASGTFTSAILVLLLALIWLFRATRNSDVIVGQLRAIVFLTGFLTLFYLDGAFFAIPLAQGHPVANDIETSIPIIAVGALAIASGELVGIGIRCTPAVVQSIVRVVAQSLLLLFVFATADIFNFVENTAESTISAWHVFDYEAWGLAALGAVLFLCVVGLPSVRDNTRAKVDGKVLDTSK